jgi:hypothetical protein
MESLLSDRNPAAAAASWDSRSSYDLCVNTTQFD